MPRYAIPGEEDIGHLFAFAADVKVIYTLRLPRSGADRDAEIAATFKSGTPGGSLVLKSATSRIFIAECTGRYPTIPRSAACGGRSPPP